ncbi:MAG: hypothetical protein HYR71_10020 [Chloroflexi bacterium]|nr:hypothetical protein [Chloroflexota bacterium]
MHLGLVALVCVVILTTACGAPTISPSPAAQPAGTTTSAPPLTQADEAIAAAQATFPELRPITKAPPRAIGASTNITVLDDPGGWRLVFWQGSGDCPAGCINHHYWYVVVQPNGAVSLAGEYVREFSAAKNTIEERGQPLWGVPK